MHFHLILHKYAINRDALKKKLTQAGATSITEEKNDLIVQGTLTPEALAILPEIKEYYLIYTNWKKLSYPLLKADALSALKATATKTYTIKTKFYDKIPISAHSVYKHLNPYLRHEGYDMNENAPDTTLYAEFQKGYGAIMYRISTQARASIKTVMPLRVSMEHLAIAIEEPELALEISDFLRICHIFKLPLYIISTNQKMPALVRKAQTETKGIAEGTLTLHIIKELPTGYLKIGFTKHASQNEKDLAEFFITEKKTLLIFGNDKYGLSQKIRDQLDHQYRLTPERKKPLRASHALSYILGFYTHQKL